MNLVFFIASFVLLAAFLVVGRVVNWFAKRPVVNAARLFFWLLLLLIVGFTLWAYTSDRVSLRGFRMLGQATAVLVPSLLVAFFLGRSFARKTRRSQAASLSLAPGEAEAKHG